MEKHLYLLFFSSNQIPPFMYWLAEVYGVHGDLDFTDDIMFTKTVKVKNLQHQSLTAQFTVGYLKKKIINNVEWWGGAQRLKYNIISVIQTLKVKVSLNTGQRFLRWTLVSNFFFLSGNM